MISMLLGVIGIDLKREVRGIAVTVALALAGAFLAIVAIAIGLRALYLWLELQVGVFPALGILGGASVLLAIVLFFFAFKRGRKAKPAPRAANPLQASAAALAEATEQAVHGATDSVRNGSRKQMYTTILVAALAGLLLGRRL
jgi:hypothetical protein